MAVFMLNGMVTGRSADVTCADHLAIDYVEIQDRGGASTRLRNVCAPRELATEADLDQPEVLVIAATVRTKHGLVAFGDDGEAAALTSIDWALEIDDRPGLEDETARGDDVAVDRDVGDAPEGAMIAEPQVVHLARAGEHVPGFDLADCPAVGGDDLDAEIADAHVRPPIADERLVVRSSDRGGLLPSLNTSLK